MCTFTTSNSFILIKCRSNVTRIRVHFAISLHCQHCQYKQYVVNIIGLWIFVISVKIRLGGTFRKTVEIHLIFIFIRAFSFISNDVFTFFSAFLWFIPENRAKPTIFINIVNNLEKFWFCMQNITFNVKRHMSRLFEPNQDLLIMWLLQQKLSANWINSSAGCVMWC